jgi:hypothetical protein
MITGGHPPAVSVVLDESRLKRRIGDELVMRDQLRHLTELADYPNITIRVLPLSAQHAVPGPAFVIFRFGPDNGAAVPQEVVASEQLKTILTVEDEHEAHLHRLVFNALAGACLDPAASRALIHHHATSWLARMS